MKQQLSVGELARNPITLAVAGFSTATALLQIEVLTIVGTYLWGHLGQLFTVTSLAGFTVAPNVDFVPQNPLVVLAVITGVAYAAKLVVKMFRDLDDKLDQ